MPIPKELRQYYGEEFQRKREEILERAGHRCERCRKPNGFQLFVSDRLPGMWFDWETGRWRDGQGNVTGYMLAEIPDRRLIRVVLTIAHLDHDPRNNDDGNLAALCQRCHLFHDRKQHAATARRTRAARVCQLWLLLEIERAAWAEGLVRSRAS